MASRPLRSSVGASVSGSLGMRLTPSSVKHDPNNSGLRVAAASAYVSTSCRKARRSATVSPGLSLMAGQYRLEGPEGAGPAHHARPQPLAVAADVVVMARLLQHIERDVVAGGELADDLVGGRTDVLVAVGDQHGHVDSGDLRCGVARDHRAEAGQRQQVGASLDESLVHGLLHVHGDETFG